MIAPAWVDADPADLAPVVLVVGGFLTAPAMFRPLADELAERGAAGVLIAPVYPPDWILVAGRGLGPILGRVGRALLAAGERSAASPASRGAPILYVGHSAGGVVGRLLTSPIPFEGRRLGASGRIGALVTLGTPHLVGDEAGWGRRAGQAGARFANRHVPGAFFAPTTAYLAVASDSVVGDGRAPDGRVRFMRRVYAEILPSLDEPVVAGDGLVPVAAALLDGARHLVLPDTIHGPSRRAPWYGSRDRIDAWWPIAVEAWRDALRARQARRANGLARAEAAATEAGADDSGAGADAEPPRAVGAGADAEPPRAVPAA